MWCFLTVRVGLLAFSLSWLLCELLLLGDLLLLLGLLLIWIHLES